MTTTKTCSKCKITKYISEFGKLSDSKDGLKYQCKKCRSSHYFANKNEISKKAKLYRDSNKIKIYEQRKLYRSKHRGKIKLRRLKYKTTPVGKIVLKNISNKYRATRKNKADGTIPLQIHYPLNKELITLLEKQDNLCNYCKCKISSELKNIHLDHIHPLSKGGEHSIDNVQWLCATCNLSKSNKT